MDMLSTPAPVRRPATPATLRRDAARTLVVAAAAAALAVTALLASAASLFTLPAPTGPAPVGTVSFTLPRRPDAIEPAEGSYAVQLWYPARSGAPPAAYEPYAAGWKERLYRRLIRTHAAGASAPAAGRFPLLLYAASWHGRRNENTALAEDLASRGYVVAAIDDPLYDDPPPRRIGGPLDLTSTAAYRATLVLADIKANYEARRLSALLDRLADPATLRPYGLAGRIDTARVGALGYSFGGAAARLAAQHDPRIRASANFDGWLFPSGGPLPDRGVPYLLVSTVDPPVTADDLRSPDLVHRYTMQLTHDDLPVQMRQLQHDGTFVEIAGTDHAAFSDVPLYSVSMRLRHRADPLRTARLLQRATAAFFDRTLRGAADARVTGDGDAGVTVQRWRGGTPLGDGAHPRGVSDAG